GAVQLDPVGQKPASVAIQPDGKIVVGYDLFAVRRLNPDGSVDKSFGTDGTVGYTEFQQHQTPDLAGEARDLDKIAVNPDGSILALGRTELSCCNWGMITAMKLDGDGHFDSSYGTNGVANWSGSSEISGRVGFAVDQAGGVIAAGGYFGLMRLTPGGDLDR